MQGGEISDKDYAQGKELMDRECLPYTPTLDQNRRETADLVIIGNGYPHLAPIEPYQILDCLYKFR